ncbi:MAG: Rrf2 family transcriptional regulator [Deltaproteobacteria bacterium]|nr:Rrf2 family transcriptional regulator [Deltaproteobacteria bacterium]
MVITRATEYAIRALLFLAKQPKGQIVYKKDICESQKITPAFLTKILQPLIKDGIVGSQRGVGGGFYLLKDPSRINILDVIQSQEGPIFLNHCLSPEEECSREKTCPVKNVWEEANRGLVKTLSDYDFQSLANCEKQKTGDNKTK